MKALAYIACVCAFADPTSGQQPQPSGDWRLPIQRAIFSRYRPTQATYAKDGIVTAGSVIVLKKGSLEMDAVGHFAGQNVLANGKPKPQYAGAADLRVREGRARVFVPGEKFWLTRVLWEPKADGVLFEFLSDAFEDVRYWGTLKLSFPKGSPPTPEEMVATLDSILGVDGGQGASQTAPQSAEVPVIATQQAVSPVSIDVGQTPDQVKAIMGQPDRIENAGDKQIFFFKDLKVIFTVGKVTDVE